LDIDQIEFEDANWGQYAGDCAQRDLDDVGRADMLILDLPEPKVGKGGLYQNECILLDAGRSLLPGLD